MTDAITNAGFANKIPACAQSLPTESPHTEDGGNEKLNI
jgi:hypothetical protein